MTSYQPSGPTNFEDLVKPLPKKVQEVAVRLRAILTSTIPEAEESVSGGAKIGMALYSIGGPNSVICGIQPTQTTCKLFFHGWKQLKNAGYRLEGSGTYARHIKVHTVKDLKQEELPDLIKIAKDHVRHG